MRLVAVTTLALGIGVNTAMFSVLHTLLFQPLPYPGSEQLVRVFRTSSESRSWPHSPANFLDRREQNRVFAWSAAFSGRGFNSSKPGQPPEILQGIVATGDFFLTLGASPALGRVFTSADDRPGENRVAVISHAFWLRHFGGNTNVLGQALSLDGETSTIIGVMPRGFGQRLCSSVDLWKPVGAGLFLRGLDRILQGDPGWQMDNLLTAQVALTARKYETAHARQTFARELEERLAGLPGVRRVGLSSMVPFSDYASRYLDIEGRPTSSSVKQPLAYYETVSPGFFGAMGMVLKEGRIFNAGDTTNRPAVVIVNESTARNFWPGQSAVGKRINDGDPASPWQEIVGVVNDVRFPARLESVDTPFQIYRPMTQMSYPWLAMEIRLEGTEEPIKAAVRRVVGEIDPELSVVGLRLARETLSDMLGRVSVIGRLLAAFAVLGVILAAVGIYGVVSYTVARRTGEFGLRMALGAQRGRLLWLVLKQGCVPSVSGAVLGLAGAFALTQLMMKVLPEIPIRDTGVVVLPTIALIGIAALACWLPAHRATQADPMEALRGDF